MWARVRTMVLMWIEDYFENKLWDIPNKPHFIERRGKLTKRILRRIVNEPWKPKYPYPGSVWRDRKTGIMYQIIGFKDIDTFYDYFDPPKVVCASVSGKIISISIYDWYRLMEKTLNHGWLD